MDQLLDERPRGNDVRQRATAKPGPVRPTVPDSECARTRRTRHAPHTILFMEADPARRIYEVLEGVVMLYKLLPDGRRQVVELVSAGDLFGVSAQQVYDCAAETLTPTTIIAYERAQVETSSELRKVVTKSLARKLTALHDHAVTLGRKSALERVATFLMRFIPDRGGYNCIGPAEHGPDEKTIHLAMTRQEIADYLGLTIETVSRAFSELRRRGAIVIDRQDEVRITDVCGLCHLTGAH